MAKIIVMSESGNPLEFSLDRERLTIGRATHNDIVIDDPAVSMEHAVIVSANREIYLEDLGSTNGSMVNGQPIRKHFLQRRDVIQIAKHVLVYSEAPLQAESASAGIFPANHPKAPAGGAAPKPERSRTTVAKIKILNGFYAGKSVVLTKPLMTIGRPGIQVAAIVRQADGYYITHIEGEPPPLVNATSIGESICPLSYDDVIDLGGTEIRFCSADA